MKTFLKAGLLTAAVMTAISLAPSAHAYAYKDANQGMRADARGEWNRSDVNADYRPDWRRSDVRMRPGSEWASRTIPASELPINRGVGRGSNKPMLDLNRGYGSSVTTEPGTGYTPPSDRDRDYGAMPAGYESRGYANTYDARYDNRPYGRVDNRVDGREAGWRRTPASRN